MHDGDVSDDTRRKHRGANDINRCRRLEADNRAVKMHGRHETERELCQRDRKIDH